MKVAIVGSRDYPSRLHIVEFVRALPPHATIISGGARGVDTWAAEAASERWDLDVEVFPALWDIYGKSAGYLRNIDIVNAADRVVAFWDGRSAGTKHTIKLAKQAGKPVEIHFADGTITVTP